MLYSMILSLSLSIYVENRPKLQWLLENIFFFICMDVFTCEERSKKGVIRLQYTLLKVAKALAI